MARLLLSDRSMKPERGTSGQVSTISNRRSIVASGPRDQVTIALWSWHLVSLQTLFDRRDQSEGLIHPSSRFSDFGCDIDLDLSCRLQGQQGLPPREGVGFNQHMEDTFGEDQSGLAMGIWLLAKYLSNFRVRLYWREALGLTAIHVNRVLRRFRQANVMEIRRGGA